MPGLRGAGSGERRRCWGLVGSGLRWQRSLPTPAPRPLTSVRPPHSKLKPPLNLERKSRLLTVCLRSVLALPLLDALEKHTCLFLEPPDIQVRPEPPASRGPAGVRLRLLLLRGKPCAGWAPAAPRPGSSPGRWRLPRRVGCAVPVAPPP